MTLGQSMLAAVALAVITVLVISANKIVIQSQDDELKGESYRIAGDIASTLINEALKKKFDLSATYNYYQIPKRFYFLFELGTKFKRS